MNRSPGRKNIDPNSLCGCEVQIGLGKDVPKILKAASERKQIYREQKISKIDYRIPNNDLRCEHR